MSIAKIPPEWADDYVGHKDYQVIAWEPCWKYHREKKTLSHNFVVLVDRYNRRPLVNKFCLMKRTAGTTYFFETWPRNVFMTEPEISGSKCIARPLPTTKYLPSVAQLKAKQGRQHPRWQNKENSITLELAKHVHIDDQEAKAQSRQVQLSDDEYDSDSDDDDFVVRDGDDDEGDGDYQPPEADDQDSDYERAERKERDTDRRTEKESKSEQESDEDSEEQGDDPQEDEKEYEVERICDSKVENGRRLYEVLWKGHPKTTWEPEDCLDNCPEKLDEYRKRKQFAGAGESKANGSRFQSAARASAPPSSASVRSTPRAAMPSPAAKQKRPRSPSRGSQSAPEKRART